MANILKRMMSFGNVHEAAAPNHNAITPTNIEDDETIVDSQDLEGKEEMALIPDFAEAGITDQTTILEELSWGPAACVCVGKEARPFIISKRLLIYHSPVAARHFTVKNATHIASDNTLALPDSDPRAFFHVCRWMHEAKIGILEHHTRRDVVAGIRGACTLLCRASITAEDLEITAIQRLIFQELQTAFVMAREVGIPTPLVPETMMELWLCRGEESVLWQLVLMEMCDAFSRKPLPVYAEYDECFKVIDPLRLAVTNVMVERLRAARIPDENECSLGQESG